MKKYLIGGIAIMVIGISLSNSFFSGWLSCALFFAIMFGIDEYEKQVK